MASVHAAPDPQTQTHPCGVHTRSRPFWDEWTREASEITCPGCALRKALCRRCGSRQTVADGTCSLCADTPAKDREREVQL